MRQIEKRPTRRAAPAIGAVVVGAEPAPNTRPLPGTPGLAGPVEQVSLSSSHISKTPMSIHANTIATWASIVGVTVAGGVWVGAIGNEVENQKTKQEKMESLPADVAVLKEQTTGLKETLAEIKAQQEKILDAIRRSN